jgi:hypothetical protein
MPLSANSPTGSTVTASSTVEEHHHSITGIMFKRTAELNDDLADCCMVLTQQRHHVFWLRTLGKAGETAQIAE